MLEKIASLVTMFFFQVQISNWETILIGALAMAGMYGVFRKCGLKGWYALLPCLRMDKLGEAVGMEKEGRAAAILEGIGILLGMASILLTGNPGVGNLPDFVAVASIFAALILLIYQIKMYLVLCEVYDQKKRWVILWATLSCIPALMWGWMKQYQPLWKANEMTTDASSFFSGTKAAVLDQGLTVNIEERTATEMFKKKYLLRDIHMYIQPGHMVLLLGGSGQNHLSQRCQRL